MPQIERWCDSDLEDWEYVKSANTLLIFLNLRNGEYLSKQIVWRILYLPTEISFIGYCEFELFNGRRTVWYILLSTFVSQVWHHLFEFNLLTASLKAYLESKSKMCVFSPTNANQNFVILSMCLVFVNANVNALNSSLNFTSIHPVENARMCVCGAMTSQVEFSRYRRAFRVL